MKRRNRCFVMLLSVLCILLLSGCVRYSTTVEVKKNGKADVSILMAVIEDGDGEDSSSTSGDTSDKEKLESEGWEYQDYSEDKYAGCVISKHDIELTNLSEETKTADSGTSIQTENLKVSKDGSKYTISWDLSGDGDKKDLGQYGSYITSTGGYVRFTLRLPVKPISSNAKEISEDGKTLTWDLLDMGEERKIEATFRLSNAMPIMLCIVVTVIMILCFAAYILSKKKKRLEKETEKEDQNTMQSQSLQSAGQNTAIDPDGVSFEEADYERHTLTPEEHEEIASTITESPENE